MQKSDPYGSTPTVAERRRARRGTTLLGIAVVVAAGVVLIGAMTLLRSEPEAKPVEESAPPKVSVLTAEPGLKRVMVQSQGAVSARHDIQVLSQVAGRVVEVSPQFADGGFFDSGDVLIQIDPADYTLALRSANAEVARAEEVLAMERGRARQAKREWRDIGDKDANALFLRKPQLAAAEAALDAARAARDRAKLDLERTRIALPFDGRIRQKRVGLGQVVAAGTVLAEVHSTEAVEVRLPLTDRQLAYVDLPLVSGESASQPPVFLTVEFGGKRYRWEGKIVRTEASLDPKSRVLYAVAEVEAPYAVSESGRPPLTVGMYASAEIVGREFDNVVTLPRKVLSKKNLVPIVNADDTLDYREVEILQSDGDTILVTGLASRERVLTSRVPFATAGLKVAPEEDTAIADRPEGEATPLPQQDQDLPSEG